MKTSYPQNLDIQFSRKNKVADEADHTAALILGGF